jgi:DNA-binding transcriptional ArsR family regulator
LLKISRVHTLGGMWPPDSPPAAAAPTPPPAPPVAFNPDRIFPLLADGARRRMILALARGSAMSVTQLAAAAGKNPSLAGKHIAVLKAGGLIVGSREESPDKRRQLYQLAPHVRPEMKDGQLVLDFGFCMFRLTQ